MRGLDSQPKQVEIPAEAVRADALAGYVSGLKQPL